MYFVANTVFVNYFDEVVSTLHITFFHNITRQEHILPISLESDDFDKELLSAPKTLRELVERYKQRKLSFDNQHKTLDNEKEDDNFIGTSMFNHLAFNIFIFVMAVISVIVVFIDGNDRGLKAVDEKLNTDDKEYWIIIIWLSFILLCVLFLTIEKIIQNAYVWKISLF